jgi:hypothetical protein
MPVANDSRSGSRMFSCVGSATKLPHAKAGLFSLASTSAPTSDSEKWPAPS